MIGIRLAGKNDRISARVFIRSLNSFYDLINDVDSTVSQQKHGSVKWELVALHKSSPASVEFAGASRVEAMDYSQAIQDSILDGIDRLNDHPEQPRFYSYSALTRLRRMADQTKKLKWLSVFSNNRTAMVSDRIATNVEYIMATGSKSLGSIRGSLDALTVHSGHEFRVWSPKAKRPITCHFERSMLEDVVSHLKQEVEVIGELQRNQKGEPVLMRVEQFFALEPAKVTPSIKDMSGLLSDLYAGSSLRDYMDELRNG